MQRRRGSKYTWMPTLGSRFNEDGHEGYAPSFLRFDIGPNNNNADPPTLGSNLVSQAVIPDFPVQTTDDINAQYTLRDLTEGQDWMLKRMVGKITIHTYADTYIPTADWPQVYVTAGFFVARAIDESPSDPDLVAAEIDPLAVDNIRQPWIWRRTWLLGNPVWTRTAGAPIGGFDFPCSNMEYGSMSEGTHIDSKVSRRIMRDQRLWFCCTVMGQLSAQGAVSGAQPNPRIAGLCDLRILGAMRKSRNRPAF